MGQNGFTLVQSLIALAITAIISAITASVLTMSFRGMRSVERMDNILQMADELQMALAKESVCTPNFRGKPARGSEPVSISDIYYYDEHGVKATQPLLASGQPMPGTQGLIVSSMRIVPKAWLAVNKVVMTLEVNATKTADDIGARDTQKTLALLMEVEGGVIKRCSADTDSGSRFYEKVCMLAGDGRLYYDPATGRCLNRYEEQYFEGTQDSAQCPSGWEPLPPGVSKIAPCDDICSYSGAVDTNRDSFRISIPRRYTNGATLDSGPRGFLANFDGATKTCQCAYAVDLSPTTFKCRIKCQRLIVPFNF